MSRREKRSSEKVRPDPEPAPRIRPHGDQRSQSRKKNLKKENHKVNPLCPRCIERGRVARLLGNELALPCPRCGRIYTPRGLKRARLELRKKLRRRMELVAESAGVQAGGTERSS